jgi:nifR3 family TIM-barrel protein
MDKGFWEQLNRPFFVLAPMANVTDVAFRRIISKYGKPDVFWTEFVSADGLASEGKENLLPDLMFSDEERPIVAQLFTANPEKAKEGARILADLGFDGIDVNMGCPDKAVCKQRAGAYLSKTPHIAREIIDAVKEGAKGKPVSIKIRLGYEKNEIETWLPELLESRPAVVTVHARTKKEMSKVPARWEEVRRAVQINNAWAKKKFGRSWQKERSLIIGNGDVLDLSDARRKADYSGVDGVMLGRAIFGNPWLFNDRVDKSSLPLEEKARVMLEHTRLFEELLGGVKSFATMKKHFASYFIGDRNTKRLKMRLMETENSREVEEVLKTELENLF